MRYGAMTAYLLVDEPNEYQLEVLRNDFYVYFVVLEGSTVSRVRVFTRSELHVRDSIMEFFSDVTLHHLRSGADTIIDWSSLKSIMCPD